MLIKIARTVAIFLVKPQSAVLNSVVSQTFCVCVSNTNSHSGAGSYDFISDVGIAPNAVSNHGHSPDYFKIFRFQNGNDSQKSRHIGCSTLVPGHALKVQKLVKLQDLLVSQVSLKCAKKNATLKYMPAIMPPALMSAPPVS